MLAAAVEAHEGAIRHRRPLRVLRLAVHADLCQQEWRRSSQQHDRPWTSPASSIAVLEGPGTRCPANARQVAERALTCCIDRFWMTRQRGRPPPCFPGGSANPVKSSRHSPTPSPQLTLRCRLQDRPFPDTPDGRCAAHLFKRAAMHALATTSMLSTKYHRGRTILQMPPQHFTSGCATHVAARSRWQQITA